MLPKARPYQRVDKSGLALPIANRLRSPKHLEWIRAQKCCVPGCSNRGVHAHHLTCAGGKARSLKAGDDYAVPLCVEHHQGQDSPHHVGDEAAWWARHGVDPLATAAMYWRMSPANRGRETA